MMKRTDICCHRYVVDLFISHANIEAQSMPDATILWVNPDFFQEWLLSISRLLYALALRKV